jgi:hypothetical protein
MKEDQDQTLFIHSSIFILEKLLNDLKVVTPIEKDFLTPKVKSKMLEIVKSKKEHIN